MKKVFTLILVTLLLFGQVPTKVVENTGYIRLHIICKKTDVGCGDLDEGMLEKLKAIAKLKTAKSWVRIFASNDATFIDNIDGDKSKIITYIICHSADSDRVITNQHGIEIFYNKIQDKNETGGR